MAKYKERILSGLVHGGWELVSIEDSSPDWWCDEQWLLESRRASYGRQLFLTYTVDPIWEGPRKAGQGLLNINASRTRPEEWDDHTTTVSILCLVKGLFDPKLDQFLREIAAFQEEDA